MNDIHKNMKENLISIDQQIENLFMSLDRSNEIFTSIYREWKNNSEILSHQLQEDLIRVAIIGTIKSGKSTFVNSLFQRDLLKRGAGVVTSIVTRLISGDRLKANLSFKSWDQINAEINQALLFFPSFKANFEQQGFDLRNETHRKELTKSLAQLTTDQLVEKDTRNTNSVLLSSYLHGFDFVKNNISEHKTTKIYENDDFYEHIHFSGNEDLSVYLKDILLEVNTDFGYANIEFADCQGSDSPNPLHLSMIQDYLRLSHLLIYVISSRTGLRQADFKFLSIIKKMGIMDNILFVVNCDFNEHNNKRELDTLIQKITTELSMLRPEPQVFVFSALYNLFKGSEVNISTKDKDRLEQWKGDHELRQYSESESHRFKTAFTIRLNKERYNLLYKNHIERLKNIAVGIKYRANVYKDIISKDTAGIHGILGNIKHHQNRLDQVSQLIRKTLDGAVSDVKRKLRNDIDSFFDEKYGSILPDLLNFIKNFQITFNDYEQDVRNAGFQQALFRVFQDFKQVVDEYMTQNLTPSILGFVKEKELDIEQTIENIARPFSIMIQDALTEYQKGLTELGLFSQNRAKTSEFRQVKLPETKSVRLHSGINLPPTADLTMTYSLKIKVEAVSRLGAYAFMKTMRKIFKRQNGSDYKGEMSALMAGVKRMKSETERSILFHFKDVRENIKFQYLLKLTDVMAQTLYQTLIEQFQMHITDLTEILDLINEKQIDKEKIQHNLDHIDQQIETINSTVNRIGEQLAFAS